jgi:hypothetical protein
MAVSDDEFARSVNRGCSGGVNDGSLGYTVGAQTRAGSNSSGGAGSSGSSGEGVIQTPEQGLGAVTAGILTFWLWRFDLSLPWYGWLLTFFASAFLATKFFNRVPWLVRAIGYLIVTAGLVVAIFVGYHIYQRL